MPDELKGEERLAELQRGKDRLTKDIDDRRREPQFRVNLYESQLRRSLQNLLPNEPDIDLLPFRSGDLFIEDLERLTTTTLKALERSLDINEQEHQTLQAQIDSLGVELRDQENALAELETLFALDAAAGQELDVGLSKNEEERNKIEQFKHRKCPFGDVLIRNCAHVQDRQRILQIAKLQDAHAIEQAEVRRGEERRKIAEWKVDLRKEMERIKKEQQDALERRKALVVHASAQRDSARDLERTRNGLVIWMQKRDGSGGYEELDLLRRKLDATEIEIAKVENELAKLLRQHDENRERLAAIFSWAVRSVLSFSGYDGRVSLENRELAFSITHGPAMSGEAVESLAVLLADIACLVYNMVSGRSHLPGFLMHDSPREADLGIKIYRSFLRFAASLQALLGGLESCSFQYVLTTTTPPPKELQTKEYVKLQLNASRPEGLLFRRNIAQARLDDLSSGGDPL
ncbi:MAG: hypothetical protein EPO21_18275 [Chloroflexota bacterium]|nr:MAG: hypothetical protein EPO21_18275 [Chloroflexota bacterium]